VLLQLLVRVQQFLMRFGHGFGQRGDG
jgi:hypothetical protein